MSKFYTHEVMSGGYVAFYLDATTTTLYSLSWAVVSKSHGVKRLREIGYDPREIHINLENE